MTAWHRYRGCADGALYFPYIEVPTSVWFSRALLYWDRVGTIVPETVLREPERLSPYMLDLIRSELLLQVEPNEIRTEVILERLNALDESLWGDWYGKGLDARGLAKMLRPYGIRSRNVRDGSVQAKNYLRADLDEVWARYTRPGRPNVPDKLSPHVNAGTDSGTDDAGGIRPCR